MRLVLDFDDETLRRYDARGAPLLFYVAVEHDGVYFPDRQWLDFGCVVLGWWTMAILRLLEGSEEEDLCFMDGPYTLRARRLDAMVTVRSVEGPPFAATTTLPRLRKELASSANAALRHVAALGLRGDDVAALEAGLRKLQRPSSGQT